MSQQPVNQDLQQKQTYLRQNIIQQGYDAQQFVTHCINKYGEVDLGTWNMQTLANIVREFVEKIEKANRPDIKQQQQIQNKTVQIVADEDNQQWDYADVPVNQKQQVKEQKKQQNEQQWDDYIQNTHNAQVIKPEQKTVPKNEFIISNILSPKQNAQLIFNDADWQIFGLSENQKNKISPKKITSDKVVETIETKQISFIAKTLISKQQSIQPKKIQQKIKEQQTQIKKVKSANNLSMDKPSIPPVKKMKKEKNSDIPYQQYQHKRIKVKVQKNNIIKQLPNFNDIVIIKTEQISKGFLQSDFTLYHIMFKPTNYIIKRRFSDLRRLRSILHKMYPTFRLPYLQPQGWIHNSSQGKDPEMLSRYSYMVIQFLKYITINNQQLKNTQIVIEFLGLGNKKTQKQKQFVKKVLDDFNRLPKPKTIHDLTFNSPQMLLQPNPNFTKYITNHQNLLLQVDLVYEKLKRQLDNLYYFYDQVSKALADVAITFEQLQGSIAKFNFQNGTKDELRVYDGIKDMFIKFQNNINDRQNLIKNRFGMLFKYEKQNMWTIRQILDQRSKIHCEFIRYGTPQHPIIKYPQDIYTVSSTLPLQQIVRNDKNIISIQNNFWQQMCAKQIEGYWKTFRRKINENLSLISYDELDMENENLNFWNSMIKKCIIS